MRAFVPFHIFDILEVIPFTNNCLDQSVWNYFFSFLSWLMNLFQATSRFCLFSPASGRVSIRFRG